MHRYSERMFFVFLIVASFIPAFCYAGFTIAFGHFSVSRVFLCFFGSLIAVFCASVLQVFLDSFGIAVSGVVNTFFSAFFQAALVEELIKLGFVLIICASYRKKTPISLYSGALLFALFFSAFETLAYGISSPSVIGIRTFTALPLHGAATVLAVTPFHPCASRKLRRFLPLLLAILGHGLFTFSMEAGGLFVFLAYISLLGLVVTAFWYTHVYTELERSR